MGQSPLITPTTILTFEYIRNLSADPRESMIAPQPLHEKMEANLGMKPVEPFYMNVANPRGMH